MNRKGSSKIHQARVGEQARDLSDIDLEIEAESIDRIFIETRQLDRVTEIASGKLQTFRGLVLNLKIGSQTATRSTSKVNDKNPEFELETVVDEIRQAVESGVQTVEVGGQIISPDRTFLDFDWVITNEA